MEPKPRRKAGLFVFVYRYPFWQNAGAMQVEYELTESDFTGAYVAHRNRRSYTQWIRVILFWLIILVSAFALYGAVTTHNFSSVLPFLVLAFLWIVVIQGVIPRWYMRRQFTKQPGAHGPRTLTLDETGAHWRWNGGSSDVEWRNYIRSIEGTNQILFYTSPACFNILPKRALKPEQLDEVRRFIQQNIQTRR
jgi:hypothetical protein